jgi:hypothetical protein
MYSFNSGASSVRTETMDYIANTIVVNNDALRKQARTRM